MNPLVFYQTVALLLLGLGLYALVARRTLVGMLIGVELMLNGAGLSIVAAAQLTSADAVPHPQRLKLWCEVDGERRQEGNTRSMIFKIADILAHLSRGMTLQPGDILATGTPAGVGAFRAKQ